MVAACDYGTPLSIVAAEEATNWILLPANRLRGSGIGSQRMILGGIHRVRNQIERFCERKAYEQKIISALPEIRCEFLLVVVINK
jgi:hypothetical protein